jgi:nucleoside-diphosphate-sugar epimerase
MSGWDYAGQTVLVTGATGFVGGHLTRRLLQEGAEIKVLVRDPAKLPAAWQGRVEVCTGDLTDVASLRQAVRDARWVFHCAANVQTWARAADYEAVNVQGVRNLLDAIAAQPVKPERLVHVSTVDVYGFPRTPCAEDCALRPPGFGYGDSKLRGELAVHEIARRIDLSHVVLRPTNVMGPGSPFIERVGRELHRGLMLRIAGGRADAGFLSVENLVDALLWSGQAPRAHNEVYNIADPQSVTWRQVLDDLRQGIQGRGLIIDLPYALAEAAATVLEFPYRLLNARSEPLLHRLIVRIFGRTCGHHAAKLAAAGGPIGRVGYAQAMEDSVRWFLARCAK